MQTEVVHDAAPAPSQNPLPMGIIYHQQDVIPLRHVIDFIQRGHIAVHAEYTVRDDDCAVVLG